MSDFNKILRQQRIANKPQILSKICPQLQQL